MIILLILLGWILFIAVIVYAGYRHGGRKAFEDRQRLREANWRAGGRRR